MPGIISSQPIFYGKPPAEGARYIKYPVALNNTAIFSITLDIASSGMSSVQSLLIDNTTNPFALELQVQDTGQIIPVPALAIVQAPVFTGSTTFILNGAFDGIIPAGGILNLKIFNFVQPYKVWRGQGFVPPPYQSFISPQGGPISVNNGTTALVIAALSARSRFIISQNTIASTITWQVGFGNAHATDLSPNTFVDMIGPGMYAENRYNDDAPASTCNIYLSHSNASAVTFQVAYWVF